MYSSKAIYEASVRVIRTTDAQHSYLSLGLDNDVFDELFVPLEIEVIHMTKGHSGAVRRRVRSKGKQLTKSD
jgi:hypothetical protein